MSIILEILMNLLPVGISKLWKYIKRDRHFQKFWGSIEHDLLIVLPARNPTPENRFSPTFVGMLEFAHNTGKWEFFEVTDSDGLGLTEQKRNILSIGGPITNKLTALMLERPEAVYKFEGHDIIRKDKDWRLSANIGDNNEIKCDYGIISRLSSPYNPQKDVIVVAGCYGWGVQACLRLLSNAQCLQYLNTQSKHFQVLCMCEIDTSSHAMTPYILDIHPNLNHRVNSLVNIPIL